MTIIFDSGVKPWGKIRPVSLRGQRVNTTSYELKIII